MRYQGWGWTHWEWMIAVSCLLCSPAGAEEQLDTMLNDIGEYWTAEAENAVRPDASLELSIAPAWNEVVTDTGDIVPVQMLAPTRPTGPRVAQRSNRSSARTGRDSRLASVPLMIGDTGAGTCLSFGGLLDVDLAHPTLLCSRLNIAENNSPLPTDRLYYSYRHFENVTPWRFYQFSTDYSVDRHTIAGEKTFFDGMMSLEMRLPLESRLSSQLESYVVDDPGPLGSGFAPGFEPFLGDTRVEVGNISMTFKALIAEKEDFAVSCGVGFTLPTAQDVTYLITTDTTLVFPDSPDVTANSSYILDVFASNETFFIAPFAAWLYQPASRFFHQGFLQFEVAANPSAITIAGDGINEFFVGGAPAGTLNYATLFPSERSELLAQTLMRLNLGFGYYLKNDPCANFFQQLTAMFEVHYTTTLNDAPIRQVPLDVTGSLAGIGAEASTIFFGNLDNRVDIVNLVFGLSARQGSWLFTNGVTAPIGEEADDRAFDFEYNFQAQRLF